MQLGHRGGLVSSVTVRGPGELQLAVLLPRLQAAPPGDRGQSGTVRKGWRPEQLPKPAVGRWGMDIVGGVGTVPGTQERGWGAQMGSGRGVRKELESLGGEQPAAVPIWASLGINCTPWDIAGAVRAGEKHLSLPRGMCGLRTPESEGWAVEAAAECPWRGLACSSCFLSPVFRSLHVHMQCFPVGP